MLCIACEANAEEAVDNPEYNTTQHNQMKRYYYGVRHRTGKWLRKNVTMWSSKHKKLLPSTFFKLIYYTDSRHKMYKDKLQNCSCNQFHCLGICNRVETNSMTNNRGGNKGGEK